MKPIFSFVVIALLSLNNIGFAQNIRFDKYDNTTRTITSVRVASASIMPEKWEKETNWLRIEKAVREAALQGGAQVVVTPEGVLDGYVINHVNREWGSDKEVLTRFFNLGESLDGPFVQKACHLANELDIYFVFAFLERDEQSLYNTAILIDPDGDIIGRYRKTHFAQGYTINPKFYQAGDDYPVFRTPFGTVGILICYDRQLPEPARILALKGADILFLPSYGSYTDEDGWNTVLLRTRAFENRLPLVFCHPFQSLLIDKGGNIKVFGNGGSISYYEIETTSDQNSVMRNRRPEIYGVLFEK